MRFNNLIFSDKFECVQIFITLDITRWQLGENVRFCENIGYQQLVALFLQKTNKEKIIIFNDFFLIRFFDS